MKSAQGRGSEKSSPSKSQANGRRQNIRISAKKALFLPLFAEVIELTDRGFGFAASVSGQRLFFHRNAGIRRDDFEILKPGVPILALVGSDPRRGDRKEIVRWAALDHIVWDDGAPNDQASWDKMRRVGLGEFLERLDAVLRPNWYVQKWGDKSAPADLEDDLLRGLVLARIGSMDQGELNRFDPLTLSESVLYNFAQCFDTAHPDAVSLLDHVPAERLLLFGQPGPQVLSRASEARRAEVIAWFVRAGGAALKSLFNSIGVAHYDPETRTEDVRLLDALGEAVETRSFRNASTLIGQLRAAWEAFYPASSADFPTHLVVQQPDGNLALVEPAVDNPVYLPSSRSSTSDLRELGLSVIAMEPKAAQRLAESFSERFGSFVRNSERFELVALSAEVSFVEAEAMELPAFRDLDGVIPLVLTIAAFHGLNAQGTLSGGFNDLLSSFRDARVSVVPELSVVPMISDQAIADPMPQMAAWLARKRTLVLDTEWKSDIQSVADALSQLIGRSDLRVQIRAGLDEIWPNNVDILPERTLRLLGSGCIDFRFVA